MKEQVLVSNDEIIVSDLYPVLVSNKRIYIVRGIRRSFKRFRKRKVIQLDKLSAVRTLYGKDNSLLGYFFLFFILTLVSGGLLVFLYFTKNNLFSTLKWPLCIATGVLLFLAILFMILYCSIRTKIIWLEYPNNMNNKPTKIVYRHARKRDFKDLVRAIFVSIDSAKTKVNEIPYKDHRLIL